MAKIIWNRLKSFKCPKCNNFLGEKNTSAFQGYECTSCDFIISINKFNDIINNKKVPAPFNLVKEEERNQELINNL